MALRTGTASAAAASFAVASVATGRTRQCKNFIGEQKGGTCGKKKSLKRNEKISRSFSP